MKNTNLGTYTGVELCFLDKRDNKLRITARLSTPSIEKEIAYYINDVKKTVELGGYEQINDTYRYIFELYIDVAELSQRIKIDFEYDTYTGPFFPTDFSVRGFYVTDGSIMFNEGDALIFMPYTKKLYKQRRWIYWKAILLNPHPAALAAFIMRIGSWILKPFMHKNMWLISDRMDRAGDNGEAFFDHVLEHTPKGVKPVFVLERKSRDYKTLKKKGKVINPSSPFYKFYYLRAKAHISSQLDGSRLLTVRPYLKDIMREQRVIFLQHGVIEHDSSSYYNRFNFGMDMFVTTTNGEYNSIVDIDTYGCDKETVQLTGLCRHDSLKDQREKIIFICPTWRLSLLEDTQSCELSPDFRCSTYFNFFKKLLKSEKLQKKALENGYKICFYPHRMMEKLKEHLPLDGECFIDNADISYRQMFGRGALLVTDYSSVQFDFAYLKKPLLYCQFDEEEFFSAHTCGKGYMDYERDGFGPVCHDLDSTIDKICEFIDNGCALLPEYEARIDKTFPTCDHKNCQRTLEIITEICNAK